MNLIFDIGFNRGEFTHECFRKYPKCKIVGVEANLRLCEDAPRHPNLTINHAVATDKIDQKVEFFIEPGQDGISTASKSFMENSRFTKGSLYLHPNSAHWLPPIEVNSTTVDNIIDRFGKPSLIKIDVEGYEYEVIRGLNQKSGQICFEWHEEGYDILLKTISHLRSIGYEKFGMIGYMEEGDVFERVTYSEKGDPYLEEPNEYFSWEELKEEMDTFCKPERRVDYGMIWCK